MAAKFWSRARRLFIGPWKRRRKTRKLSVPESTETPRFAAPARQNQRPEIVKDASLRPPDESKARSLEQEQTSVFNRPLQDAKLDLVSLSAPGEIDAVSYFDPPGFQGSPRDGRFNDGFAWLRGGRLDGGSVAGWPGSIDGDPEHAREINLQRYDANGDPFGAEIRAAEISPPYEAELPQLAPLGEGSFAVSWLDHSHPNCALSLSIYGEDGPASPYRALAQAHNTSSELEACSSNPLSICLFSHGGFAFSWVVEDPQTFRPIRGCVQVFAPDGAPICEAHCFPSGAMLAAVEGEAGCVVAAWTEPCLDPKDGCQVRAQRFDANGAPIGPKLDAAQNASSAGATPIGLPDGGFVVLWFNQDGLSVRGRRFNAAGEATTGVFFIPSGAAEAAKWRNEATVEVTDAGALRAVWAENNERQSQAIRILPAQISPRRD